LKADLDTGESAVLPSPPRESCAEYDGGWRLTMETPHHIESNPSVMTGKPVVAGTRITVGLILEKLAAGETIEQILDAEDAPEFARNLPRKNG
jgi:uncharacterized protein DUF433